MLQGSKDLNQFYETAVPESLVEKTDILAPNDKERFLRSLSEKKKHLEIDILRHNMNQELFDDLIDLAQPTLREIKTHSRNKRLRQRVREFREEE